MSSTRDEMLLELRNWRHTYGPPRWKNRAMHELIGDIIAVVEAGPAVPADLWAKVTSAHETFIDLGDTGAAAGELLDAATELSSALVDAEVAADGPAAPTPAAGLVLTLTDDALERREIRTTRVEAADLNTRYLVAIDADGKPYRFEARHLVELRPDTGAP
jgi:hypothetical protein